ncbi:MAG: transposase [Lachnospiraceae bacterium]|nr:transposase [Lachnospiraceae bacterium]
MDDVLPDRLKKNLVSIISDMQMVSHLFGKDGSALAIAHNPNDKKAHRRHNSLECNEKGYNQLHSYALYDLQNRIYVDMIIKPGRFPNEAKALLDMMEHSNIQERVLLIADRGYERYSIMAHAQEKGWRFFIRAKDLGSQGILTNLDENAFSMEEIKKMYGWRCGIERAFRELKYTIGLTNFHEKRRNIFCRKYFPD